MTRLKSNFASLKSLYKEQRRLIDWLEDRIDGCKNPRHFGEPLRGEMSGLWRYRIGDFRVVCEIQDQQLFVLALAVGRRREIYLRRK
jgi:mRNA interferase RelE/StbE